MIKFCLHFNGSNTTGLAGCISAFHTVVYRKVVHLFTSFEVFIGLVFLPQSPGCFGSIGTSLVADIVALVTLLCLLYHQHRLGLTPRELTWWEMTGGFNRGVGLWNWCWRCPESSNCPGGRCRRMMNISEYIEYQILTSWFTQELFYSNVPTRDHIAAQSWNIDRFTHMETITTCLGKGYALGQPLSITL